MRNWQALTLAALICSAAHARKPATVGEALTDAEEALDTGRIGDAVNESERLQKTHGLTKDELKRLDLIVARCGLLLGKYAVSEKTFAKLHKMTPEDQRVTEWYARALDGNGKGEAALPLFTALVQKNDLKDGDSYWALAQLERKKGQLDAARAHAKLALEKPISMDSDELETEIHHFIDELQPKKK
jgi:tetratricopeptide (TPR) repeat protein